MEDARTHATGHSHGLCVRVCVCVRIQSLTSTGTSNSDWVPVLSCQGHMLA